MYLRPYLLVTGGYFAGVLVGYAFRASLPMPDLSTSKWVIIGYLLIMLTMAAIDIGLWLKARKRREELVRKTDIWSRQ